MHYTVSVKLGILKTGDKSEHSSLLRERKVSLEAHKVIHCALGVFFSELHNRI